MSARFIKFIQSEETLSLLKNYPHAFLLLSLVASRARRTPDPLRQTNLNEALIGDYKSCGLTRQQYRSALKVLEDLKYLEIVKKIKNGKNSTIKITIGPTIRGTIVRLINSDIWDINSDGCNHQSNHQSNHLATIWQPSGNHEQERIRMNKNDKKEPTLPFLSEIAQHLSTLELCLGSVGFSIERMKSDWLEGKIKSRSLEALLKYAEKIAWGFHGKIMDENSRKKENELRGIESKSDKSESENRDRLINHNRAEALLFAREQPNGVKVVPRDTYLEIIDSRGFKTLSYASSYEEWRSATGNYLKVLDSGWEGEAVDEK